LIYVKIPKSSEKTSKIILFFIMRNKVDRLTKRLEKEGPWCPRRHQVVSAYSQADKLPSLLHLLERCNDDLKKGNE